MSMNFIQRVFAQSKISTHCNNCTHIGVSTVQTLVAAQYATDKMCSPKNINVP